MEAISANAAQLNNVLLETDEEEYDTVALQVLQALRKLQAQEASTIIELLQQIDPVTLTIPYVFLLDKLIELQLNANKSSSRSLPPSVLPDGKLWPAIANTCLTFDPVQMRYVGQQLTRIVEVMYHGAEQTQNYVPAIQLLSSLILRLDPRSSTLSTTHYYYLKLCLYARAYHEATTVLDLPIYHVPTTDSTKTLEKRLGKHLCSRQESSIAYINPQSNLSGKITSRVYLEYYLMGALAYIGTEQWKKAQTFLEVVLVAPTLQGVSSLIMLDAYKKWLLVGLLIDGQTPHIPKAMNSNAVKHLRILAKPYECVVDAFKSEKVELLAGEIQEGLDIWQEDGNYGLIFEVLEAFKKFSIIRLGKTFAALSMEEVAQRTSLAQPNVQETFKYVQSLIAMGALQAQIIPSQKGSLGTVRFLLPTTAQKSEEEVQRELTVKTVELKSLLRHVSNYDHQLEVNKDYLEWLQKAKKARDQEKKAAEKGGVKPIGGPPGPGDLDEDMMDEW